MFRRRTLALFVAALAAPPFCAALAATARAVLVERTAARDDDAEAIHVHGRVDP